MEDFEEAVVIPELHEKYDVHVLPKVEEKKRDND